MVEVLIKDFVVDDSDNPVNNAHDYWYANHKHTNFSDWVMENYNLDIRWENNHDVLLTGSDEDYMVFVLRWA